eukprot:snap_masked-scaffold_9-processed-gene-6.32-mRNA-1 protein AED:1.00 eAED:1.00 QI:0/0/0/0/1/1/2/0/67
MNLCENLEANYLMDRDRAVTRNLTASAFRFNGLKYAAPLKDSTTFVLAVYLLGAIKYIFLINNSYMV